MRMIVQPLGITTIARCIVIQRETNSLLYNTNSTLRYERHI